MSMPGFTAEASLTRTNQYGALGSSKPQLEGSVVPQICIIDQDATAATGHVVFWCHLMLDGIDIKIPRAVAQ
jgi:hypothetical protein